MVIGTKRFLDRKRPPSKDGRCDAATRKVVICSLMLLAVLVGLTQQQVKGQNSNTTAVTSCQEFRLVGQSYTCVATPKLAVTPRVSSAQDATRSGDTPWKEFGVFLGPIQKHTGVFHNENGVFIPWTTLCTSAQSYLLQSCDSLINSDGTLTTAGDTAVGCITNGAIITMIAAQLTIPLGTIKGILGGLAEPTGCSGIVNMDQIQTSPDLQRLVQFASVMAR